MRKAFNIIVVVMGYSLLEIVALLCILGPGFVAASRPDFATIFFFGAQLLLIPGSAILFTRVLYGSANRKSRVFGGLTLIAGSTVVFWILVFALGILVDRRVPAFALTLIFVPIFLALCFIFLLIIRRARKRGVQLEAARWLTERHSGISPRERKWKTRAITWSLWIPTCTALLAVFYLPESWGIVSHLFRPGAGHLGDYEIPIPITWVVLDREVRAEGSWVDGLAGYSFANGEALPGQRLSSWQLVPANPID